jgi:hypothetical protein
MYIRITFEDLTSEKTKETQELFTSSPNGMCLCSSNAHAICSKEMQNIGGLSVLFWHLDIDILNKYYGGALNSLKHLTEYPGVSSVEILPIEGGFPSSIEQYDDLLNTLTKYIRDLKV